MTQYEAEHEKKYIHPVTGRVITARSYIAASINDFWMYSMHWKDETWVEQAKQDVLVRIEQVTKDLKNLKKAQKLLDQIEI